MRPDHPGLLRKQGLLPPSNGSVWDAAFPGRWSANAGDVWALTGLPAFPWDTVTGKTEVSSTNPWLQRAAHSPGSATSDRGLKAALEDQQKGRS